MFWMYECSQRLRSLPETHIDQICLYKKRMEVGDADAHFLCLDKNIRMGKVYH